jgi:hypothetical protein
MIGAELPLRVWLSDVALLSKGDGFIWIKQCVYLMACAGEFAHGSDANEILASSAAFNGANRDNQCRSALPSIVINNDFARSEPLAR